MSNSNKKNYALLLIAIIGALHCFGQKTVTDYHTLAKEQFNVGNYAEALNYNIKALKLSEKLNDKKQLCIALNKLGGSYYYLGNKKEALNYMFKSLRVASTFKGDSIRGIVYSNIAAMYTELHMNNDSTLNYLNKAIPLLIKYKQYAITCTAYCITADLYYNNLNNYNLALNSIIEAEKYANITNKPHDKLFVYLKYAGYYQNIKNFKQAIFYAKKAVDIEKQNNNIENKIYATRILAESYALDGNPIAHKFYKIFIELKDSVFKTETAAKIADYKVLYETEKKETQNKLLQQENSLNQIKIDARNKTIIGLLISVALIVLLIVWRLNVIKLKKKLAEIENEKKLQYDRERISRDLHDNVGGQLSYVMFSLEGNEETSLEKRTEKATHLANALRGVTGNLRETIWALNKEELSLQDIADKLKLYARNMFAYNDVKLKFDDVIENDTPLNPAFALNIFRICQEIINNVFKHAQATELTINITKNKNIHITITDNGIGFTSSATDSNSFGLTNLQTRADEINAKLSITSNINIGTSVTLTV